MSKIELKVQLPRVPNFLRVEMPGPRDQKQDLPTVQVGDLSDEALEVIAKEWRDELFKVAKEQRNPKDKEIRR